MKEIKKRLRVFDLFEFSILNYALHNVDPKCYFLNEDRFINLRDYISRCYRNYRKAFLKNII